MKLQPLRLDTSPLPLPLPPLPLPLSPCHSTSLLMPFDISPSPKEAVVISNWKTSTSSLNRLKGMGS